MIKSLSRTPMIPTSMDNDSGNNFVKMLYTALLSIHVVINQLIDVCNSSFKDFTLLNNWVEYNNNYNSPGYRIDSNGFVHLKGVVKGGTVGTVICSLPTGYRPKKTNIFPVVSNNDIGRIDVEESGNVKLVFGSGVFVSLDGITFEAD